MTEAESFWVERSADLDGPYSREQLAEMLSSGSLQPEDVVGDGQRWQTLHSLLTPRSTGRALARLLCYAAVVTLAGLSIATLLSQFGDASLQAKRQQLLTLIPGSLIALTVCVILIYLTTPRGPRAALLLLVGTMALHQGAAQLTFYRAHVALTEQMGVASMTWPRDDTLRIEGPIGTGFARQLESAMASAPGRVYLQIKSEGGLVDEAMAAAAYLKNRGSVSTVVHEHCASACAVLLAAGDEVYITPWARIGTHDLTPSLGAFSGFAKARDDYAKHLREIGFGEAFVKAARETPPDQMRYFHPVLELDQIPSAQLIGEDGSLLSFQQAALLRLAHAVKDNDVPRDMLQILADAYPDSVSGLELPILEALESDIAAVPALMNKITERADVWGVERASGTASLALLDAIAAAAGAGTQPDPGCSLEGISSDDVARQRLAMLRSAQQGEGQGSTITDARYKAFMAKVLEHPYVKRLTDKDYQPSLSDRATCAFNLALPYGLAMLTQSEIPAALRRWLDPDDEG